MSEKAIMYKAIRKALRDLYALSDDMTLRDKGMFVATAVGNKITVNKCCDDAMSLAIATSLLRDVKKNTDAAPEQILEFVKEQLNK